MLKSLDIQNYALISQLHIELHRGFTVITGETGAGKSILLGAIGLLLGQRADAKAIRNGETRCVIEAEFALEGYGIDRFFEENDLDFDGNICIVRRELTSAGKTRAFINDTPVQLTMLRELGSQLLDIHSQHQNLLLSTEDFQMQVVDIVAKNEEVLKSYSSAYTEYRDLCKQVLEMKENIEREKQDEDYLRYQLSQLDEANLETGQQEEWEQEAQTLEHAEEIKQGLYAADAVFSGSDEGNGILQLLKEARRHLSDIARMWPNAQDLDERMDSCLIELKDIAQEISAGAEDIEFNPERLETVNECLSQLYSLYQKHHVNSEEELIALADDYRSRLALIDHSDEQLEALRKRCDEAHERVMKEAEALSQRRSKAAKTLEKEMLQRLVPLGMPNVKFHVEITRREEPTAKGVDHVEFLFSANKNGTLQPIRQIASGGEIARVMLSLKALISGVVSLPTIIFDEIDTGVSGQIAERMALMMKEMGDGGRQVISITHLPQIAARGDYHFRVFKEDDDVGTNSHIEELSHNERITEIAHMLSGAEITDAAIKNAEALLNS
ncbi:MAG: DNA repair protein RecN [Paludibacteraceae bacterium]|nr:DNA repair protein RecN [Bacteroidaceae bacterium]MBR2178228.1 DNA repair protein RecN [Paludibacteraceae bacterium]